MTANKKTRELAFQALVETVGSTPLMRIKPEGYAVATGFGRHFSFVMPPPDTDYIPVYSMNDLRTAYAMGRADHLIGEAEALKDQRRGDAEYRSWFKGGLFRKMRRIWRAGPTEMKLVCGYPQCGDDCERGCGLSEEAKSRLLHAGAQQ